MNKKLFYNLFYLAARTRNGPGIDMGKIATAGLAPAIFGPVMNINGSSLASWWHNHLPKDEVTDNDNIEGKEKGLQNDVV